MCCIEISSIQSTIQISWTPLLAPEQKKESISLFPQGQDAREVFERDKAPKNVLRFDTVIVPPWVLSTWEQS